MQVLSVSPKPALGRELPRSPWQLAIGLRLGFAIARLVGLGDRLGGAAVRAIRRGSIGGAALDHHGRRIGIVVA
jgi:hypothetical protein